jgi:hypothetical protein
VQRLIRGRARDVLSVVTTTMDSVAALPHHVGDVGRLALGREWLRAKALAESEQVYPTEAVDVAQCKFGCDRALSRHTQVNAARNIYVPPSSLTVR